MLLFVTGCSLCFYCPYVLTSVGSLCDLWSKFIHFKMMYITYFIYSMEDDSHILQHMYRLFSLSVEGTLWSIVYKFLIYNCYLIMKTSGLTTNTRKGGEWRMVYAKKGWLCGRCCYSRVGHHISFFRRQKSYLWDVSSRIFDSARTEYKINAPWTIAVTSCGY